MPWGSAGKFLTGRQSYEMSSIVSFYEREYLNYIASSLMQPVEVEAELMAYGWIVSSEAGLKYNQDPVFWALKNFAAREGEERRRLCAKLISGAVANEGTSTEIPRDWWEDHPEYQGAWNSWFGNPDGHWPDGVYRKETQRQEEKREREEAEQA